MIAITVAEKPISTASKKTSPPSAACDPGYTRLHITPLDADLLSVIVPSSVRPDARNISYHSLETFPEKRFGFVDLPSAAADRLRNKLNGAVLKGVKLRIQPARQKKKEQESFASRKHSDDDEMAPSHSKGKSRRHGKKANKDFMQSATFGLTTWRRLGGGVASEEIPGIQLEPGRQVKRGWTEGEDEKIARKKAKKEERSGSSSKGQRGDKGGERDKGKKGQKSQKSQKTEKHMRQKASKYTDKKECLIKTILPPKAMAAEKLAAATAAAGGAVPTTSAESVLPADEDDEARARRRKRDKRARHVVVHEFAHSTKFPTFLKSAAADGAGGRATQAASLEYVDGKGWVDGSGDIVEATLSTRPAIVTAKIDTGAMRAKNDSSSDDSGDSDDTSDDATSSSGDSSEDEEEAPKVAEKAGPSASGTQLPVMTTTATATATAVVAGRPKSSGSAKGLTIKIPAAVEVHPLEALYKKPKGATADAGGTNTKTGSKDSGSNSKPAAEPFSFFGASADDIEDEAGDNDGDGDRQPISSLQQPPMTPYTRKELEWRNVRSAAPTPDTAHPNRISGVRWPFGDRMDEDVDEEKEREDVSRRKDEDEKDEADDDDELEGKDKAKAGETAATNDPTGDFESWFWDNRGDLNRSWKRRRKLAAKEKRYRDNRARAGRAI